MKKSVVKKVSTRKKKSASSKKEALPYLFYIEVGDIDGVNHESGGHRKTEKFLIESSHSLADVEAAYYKTQKAFKVNLTEECEEPENAALGSETIIALMKADKCIFDDIDPEFLLPEDFSLLYLRMAKLGNPKIITRPGKEIECLQIGGYGLFEDVF